MTPPTLLELLAEYERISQRIGERLSPRERDEMRAAIVSLFKETDSAIEELARFKESIRDLIAQFKALPAPADTVPSAPPPVSIRHDHIGASTYIERGWSAISAGHWPDAELHLRRAVALDGTSVTAQALLGWALMYRGREDDALQICQEALTLVPDHGLAHVVIGAICLRKGIIGEAIEHLTRVADRAGDPRAVLYANYWLGVAYLDRDMAADAEEALRRAVTLGPNLAEGWLELGHALWRRDRLTEARQAWVNGSQVRHSPMALVCRQLLDLVANGGRPTRSHSR